MTEELSKIQKELKAVEAFLKSPAHAGFIKAQETIICQIEEVILEISPETQKQTVEQYELRGERRCRQSLLNYFEQVRVMLETKVDELIEMENKTNTIKPSKNYEELDV